MHSEHRPGRRRFLLWPAGLAMLAAGIAVLTWRDVRDLPEVQVMNVRGVVVTSCSCEPSAKWTPSSETLRDFEMAIGRYVSQHSPLATTLPLYYRRYSGCGGPSPVLRAMFIHPDAWSYSKRRRAHCFGVVGGGYQYWYATFDVRLRKIVDVQFQSEL
jgi:hypothetical protein